MNKKLIKTIFGLIIILLLPLIVQASETTSIFGDDITWQWEYRGVDEIEEGMLPYGLYIPSDADKYENIPMIVSIHGYGGTAASEDALRSGGLPGTIEKWDLDNFNAYVLIPHLFEYNDSWYNSTSVEMLKAVLDFVIDEYNVDTENIIISGESRGGTSAIYMAYSLPEYFSKCAVFSPFSSGPFNTSIDTLCFYSWYADDARDYAKYLKSAYGEDRVFSNDAGHGSVGYTFLCQDGGVLSDARYWYSRKW